MASQRKLSLCVSLIVILLVKQTFAMDHRGPQESGPESEILFKEIFDMEKQNYERLLLHVQHFYELSERGMNMGNFDQETHLPKFLMKIVVSPGKVFSESTFQIKKICVSLEIPITKSAKKQKKGCGLLS